MKKILYLTIALLLVAAPALSVVSYSSGTKTTSGQITDSMGALTGVLVMTDGTNNATATLRDGETGKVIAGPFVVVGASRFGGGTWEIPVRYSSSLWLTLSGTGASAVVYYTHEL